MIYESTESVFWDEVGQNICRVLAGVCSPSRGNMLVC
jgi:hypothetical protein